MPAADTRLVAYADGPTSARIAPADALSAAALTGSPEVLLGLTVERHRWLDDPALRGVTAGLATAFETTFVALVAALTIQLLLTIIIERRI